MAHISDGILSAPVLVGGALITVALTRHALAHLDWERLPQAAALAAAFFVASTLSIPLGPSSLHLSLNGLMGLLLGWTALPVILVTLILQSAFLGYGGLLTLGVNALNLALPALICHLALGPRLRRQLTQSLYGSTMTKSSFFWLGALAGGLGVALTGLCVATSLLLSAEIYLNTAKLLLFSALPLMLLEGFIGGTLVAFLAEMEPRAWLPENTSP